MSTATIIDQIGETAGVVWQTLNENGPMSVTKLVKAMSLPRDTVMQAIGWLAREGKLTIEGDRTRMISLR
jgi:hypothetical protein